MSILLPFVMLALGIGLGWLIGAGVGRFSPSRVTMAVVTVAWIVCVPIVGIYLGLHANNANDSLQGLGYLIFAVVIAIGGMPGIWLAFPRTTQTGADE